MSIFFPASSSPRIERQGIAAMHTIQNAINGRKVTSASRRIAPVYNPATGEQIAALPLGSRVRLDPWNNEVRLLHAKPVSLISAREAELAEEAGRPSRARPRYVDEPASSVVGEFHKKDGKTKDEE